MSPFTWLPWLLLAAVVLALIIAVVGLCFDSRDLRRAEARIDGLIDRNEELGVDNANLTRNWHELARELAATRRDAQQFRGERDLARGTVRELLDAQATGRPWPPPRPMPQVPSGDALTEQFTRIVERHKWQEPPS